MKQVPTIILLTLLAVGAFAVVEVIQPGPGECCDACVFENSPDQNWGDWTHVMFGNNSTLDIWLTLVRFYELEDPRFDDIDLNEATLWLRMQLGGCGGSPPLDCVVRKIYGDWDQDTVTWNNKPGYDIHPAAYFTFTYDEDWIEIDVTELVEDWLDNDETPYGFYVGPYESHFCQACCYSGDYLEIPDIRPALKMNYTPDSAVEQTSWGAIKALE